MKRIHYSLILSALFLIASCEKDLSLEGNSPVLTEENFKDLISLNKFQLRAFYSDIPVDYIENDNQVNLETDLWKYVSPYLKDDVNTFYEADNSVVIEQNAQKIPGVSDPSLTRNYLIGTDAGGVSMRFLDYQYNPLQYHLHEMTENYFILSIKWNQGATLFSRFERIP